jgi:aldose 1-epimerase
VRAELEVGDHSEVLSAFPFPHSVEVNATLRDSALTIATTVRPSSDVAVPLVFGYHPYLRLPNVPRAAWQVEMPDARRLELDELCIPTGRSEASAPIRGPLGRRTFDDGFELADCGEPFVLAGGGRRIEVVFEEGYPYAQVFAPPDDAVVCFEPMTAPTDALRGCLGPPPAVSPGECSRARVSRSRSSVSHDHAARHRDAAADGAGRAGSVHRGAATVLRCPAASDRARGA